MRKWHAGDSYDGRPWWAYVYLCSDQCPPHGVYHDMNSTAYITGRMALD